MVTWGIADEFGGMTSMCIQRARTYEEHEGLHAPILTFEPKPGYAGVIAALDDAGHAFDGMEILNIYHYYRSAPLGERETVPGAALLESGAPRDATTMTQEDDDGRAFCTVATLPDTDMVVRREYVRGDGTTFLVDETQVDESGAAAKRRLSLLAADGRVVGAWSRAGDFYRDWLRELAGTARTAMIVDSNFVAGVFVQLEEPNIVKFKVLHSSHVGPLHRSGPQASPADPGRPGPVGRRRLPHGGTAGRLHRSLR